MATKVIDYLIRQWRDQWSNQWSNKTRARSDLGQRGEALAAKELKRRGYQILERRWRCPFGEIDIVARDGDTVVVVEVKTRVRNDQFSPVDAVDAKKQHKLVRLAHAYARAHLPDDVPVRFDVIGITAAPGKRPILEHILDAFEA